MSIWAVVSQCGLSVLVKKSVNRQNYTLAFLLRESIIYATVVAERGFHEQKDDCDSADPVYLFANYYGESRELGGRLYPADRIVQENAVSI